VERISNRWDQSSGGYGKGKKSDMPRNLLRRQRRKKARGGGEGLLRGVLGRPEGCHGVTEE